MLEQVGEWNVGIFVLQCLEPFRHGVIVDISEEVFLSIALERVRVQPGLGILEAEMNTKIDLFSGAAAYRPGNINSRTITEVKQR